MQICYATVGHAILFHLFERSIENTNTLRRSLFFFTNSDGDAFHIVCLKITDRHKYSNRLQFMKRSSINTVSAFKLWTAIHKHSGCLQTIKRPSINRVVAFRS